MTLEVPITRRESRFHDDNENESQLTSSLEQQDSAIILGEVGESDASPPTETLRSWTLDDVEGAVLEILDDIAIASAGEALEKVVSGRLCGFVATWGTRILEEVLKSAIAPTEDVCVDSNDLSIVNNPRVLLGRRDLALETLDPPRSCPLDLTYQRGQIPIKPATQNPYDNEALHHAAKVAYRSHAYPASVASSRMTTKSRVRRKQPGTTTTHGELTGPQPGVPFSTEPPIPRRHHIASPRKAVAIHPAEPEHPDPGTATAGLQLDIDTEATAENNDGNARSPPPLSQSTSSITSPRRRPHPPESKQNRRTLCFGEKEEEVKVEFAVQKAPPRKNNVSRSILPDIDGGRFTSHSHLPYPAFGGAFNSSNSSNSDSVPEKEILVDDDPLDQHFCAMPLSPGVKVRAGEESNNGPDLPLFASRMRRSTFAHMETVKLPTQASTQLSQRTSTPIGQPVQHQPQKLGKGTFLTETAWVFSTVDKNSATPDPVVPNSRSRNFTADRWSKLDDVSTAEPLTSCSCHSSSSLTLFRRQGKVERPCRSCSGAKSQTTKTEAMDFTNLVKQRAFHLKPPCLPTSSSPSKRAPGASPRRVTSAPASSPLARLTKNSHNRDLNNATKIM